VNDRRILDVKSNFLARAGDAYLTIVSVKEPGSHGWISCNFEQMKDRSLDNIATKITEKAQK